MPLKKELTNVKYKLIAHFIRTCVWEWECISLSSDVVKKEKRKRKQLKSINLIEQKLVQKKKKQNGLWGPLYFLRPSSWPTLQN